MENMTIECGYTDKTTHTPLVRATWAGMSYLRTGSDKYTLELGSLTSDYSVTNSHIYLKFYVLFYNDSSMGKALYYYHDSGAPRIMIPIS